jgi:hypothetical protein
LPCWGILLIVLNVALLKTTNTSPTCVQAYDDISNIWGTQIIDFYNRDYATVKNGTFIGKYYKVGIMGHHRVVKFSDEISLKTKEIETYTNNCSVGSLSNLTITQLFTIKLIFTNILMNLDKLKYRWCHNIWSNK